MQDSGISVLFKGINFQRLLLGLWVTLRIALVTIGISLVLGLLFGLVMMRKNRLARGFCRAWLEIVRFMPQLVLLYLVYFGFSRIFGWNLEGELSAVLVFSFWGIAEMGDLFRGALTSIPLHQRESAAALGLMGSVPAAQAQAEEAEEEFLTAEAYANKKWKFEVMPKEYPIADEKISKVFFFSSSK